MNNQGVIYCYEDIKEGQYTFGVKAIDDYATMIIGNKSGITGRYPLKEKLSSYGINDNMAICSSVNAQDEYSLYCVNLKTYE